MEWVRGKCVGRGAFGAVHVAVDRATGRAFAVKSVEAKGGAPAAAMACLESEIRILRRLSSPYVVEYLGDDGDAATTRNLHMELVPGRAPRRRPWEGLVSAGLVASCGGWRRAAVPARRGWRGARGRQGRNVLVGCDGDGRGAKLADFGASEAGLRRRGVQGPAARRLGWRRRWRAAARRRRRRTCGPSAARRWS